MKKFFIGLILGAIFGIGGYTFYHSSSTVTDIKTCFTAEVEKRKAVSE